MPQIPDTCEFAVDATGVDLETCTNGDTIVIKTLLGRDAAAALAYLVNTDNHLAVEIKIAP